MYLVQNAPLKSHTLGYRSRERRVEWKAGGFHFNIQCRDNLGTRRGKLWEVCRVSPGGIFSGLFFFSLIALSWMSCTVYPNVIRSNGIEMALRNRWGFTFANFVKSTRDVVSTKYSSVQFSLLLLKMTNGLN